jgi:sigma-E factor negative regulatory protein RseC
MTENEAVVISLDGSDAYVDVNAACSGCEQKTGGCGLGDGKGKRPQRVPNKVGAKVGDKVILSIPDGLVLRAVLHCYLLPLALAFVAALLGMAVAGDPGAFMGGLVGLIAGWLALRRVGHREPLVTMRLKDPVVYFHRNPSI